MLIKKNKTANISNYFVKSDNIGKDLAAVAKKVNDGVFGIEMHKSEDVVSRWLITPPSIRIRPGIMDRIAIVDHYTFYEGYLSDPFFLPLYGDLQGECIADIERIVLEPGERICLQWLFRKKTIDKVRAMDMYESYLMGNGIPMSSPIIRSLQESVLGMLNKLSNTNTEREYNTDVEDKIDSFCFQFQLKIGIYSNRQNEIKGEINDILSQYNDCNTLKIARIKDKYMAEQFQGCSLSKDSNNILSVREFISLLGVRSSSSPVLVQQHLPAVAPSGIVKLLPMYMREKAITNPNLVSDLAGALKRVGLISTARIANESIQAGVRLTVVQCAIPKGRTLTNLTKARDNIQAALGVTSLGVEQGTEADTVRFTIPNTQESMISLRELVESDSFQQYSKEHDLAFVVGVDEVNNPIYLSLVKLVHLLIAGSTGSGKSVFLNAIVLTLIM